MIERPEGKLGSTEMLNDLEKHLSEMDLPEQRRDLTSPSNVRWLVRNLRVRNGKHPMIKEVIKELNLMVRKGN